MVAAILWRDGASRTPGVPDTEFLRDEDSVVVGIRVNVGLGRSCRVPPPLVRNCRGKWSLTGRHDDGYFWVAMAVVYLTMKLNIFYCNT